MNEYSLTLIGWFIVSYHKYLTYTKLREHGASEWGAYSIASTITRDEYIEKYSEW